MAVKIRLKRFGKKKAPFYRLVVTDSRAPRDGKSIEEIGYYDPTKTPIVLVIKDERVTHWLSNGAQPTETVFRLLGDKGLVQKKVKVPTQPGVSKKDKQKKSA